MENIPGILLEFLSGLKPKTALGTKLAFLLQGGFPEASQSRCCEKYLETLPAQLGCSYGGTLIKGDMFGLSLMNDKNRRKLLVPFTEMGRYYARTGYFDKAAVNRFAGPEYLPKAQIRMFRLIGQPRSASLYGAYGREDGLPDAAGRKTLRCLCPQVSGLFQKST